jgi:hypothetical protein
MTGGSGQAKRLTGATDDDPEQYHETGAMSVTEITLEVLVTHIINRCDRLDDRSAPTIYAQGSCLLPLPRAAH